MSPDEIQSLGLGVSAFAAGYIFAQLEEILTWAWKELRHLGRS